MCVFQLNMTWLLWGFYCISHLMSTGTILWNNFIILLIICKSSSAISFYLWWFNWCCRSYANPLTCQLQHPLNMWVLLGQLLACHLLWKRPNFVWWKIWLIVWHHWPLLMPGLEEQIGCHHLVTGWLFLTSVIFLQQKLFQERWGLAFNPSTRTTSFIIFQNHMFNRVSLWILQLN